MTDDVANLGFKGEICFVKPGRALNHLVPRKQAIFFSDPDAKNYIQTVDVSIKFNPLIFKLLKYRPLLWNKNNKKEDLKYF